VNHSLDYIDQCGPEPSTSDYTDLQRWEKWMAWHRRFSKFFPGSNGEIRADGRVIYDPVLKSQKTRQFREKVTP
jgi:hypothetical protein